MPQRWKGALYVCDPASKAGFFLDLTPGAGAMIHQKMGDANLRGKIILAQRETHHLRSPLLIEFAGEVENPEALPAEVDPLITLQKIWGISDL